MSPAIQYRYPCQLATYWVNYFCTELYSSGSAKWTGHPPCSWVLIVLHPNGLKTSILDTVWSVKSRNH